MNAKTRSVLAALGAVPADAPESDADHTPASMPTPSFDGGARRSPPLPPEPHGEWLVRVLWDESATPSDWPWPGA
jgi:hypothetical protein